MAKLTMKQVKGYLRTHGVSPNMVDAIRLTMIEDAIQNGKDVQADRIYTLIALMLHDVYQMGQKRIVKGLQHFDKLCGLTADEYPWEKLMEELYEKTGIIVRSGDDDRLVFEYDPKWRKAAEE